MSLSMRGQTGQLKLGYQSAAVLGAWTLADGGRVDATVTSKNEAWLDTGNLILCLNIGRKMWVWRQVEIYELSTVLGCRVTGNPEVRDAR